MKHAIIDVGSNSFHMNVYEIQGTEFKLLFRSKNMVGLAGYVEDGRLSDDGMEAAENALIEFKKTLQSLSIENISVFATASLRNIKNTYEVVERLNKETGFYIEIINESEEALLSYRGAMMELHVDQGAFIDIGGASTEIVTFKDENVLNSCSCKIGSLSLFKSCVGKIIPGQKSSKRLSQLVDEKLSDLRNFTFDFQPTLVCSGGTARTVLKLAKVKFNLSDNCISANQVDTILKLFLNKDKNMIRLLLRTAPDRVHTLVPGLFILSHVMHLYKSEKIIVSKYGIREGYLCKKIN